MAASRIPNPLGQGSSPWGYANFYLRKVLSGCIRGLGPCGLGSNPSMETNLCIVSSAVVAASLHGVGRRFNPYTMYQF